MHTFWNCEPGDFTRLSRLGTQSDRPGCDLDGWRNAGFAALQQPLHDLAGFLQAHGRCNELFGLELFMAAPFVGPDDHDRDIFAFRYRIIAVPATPAINIARSSITPIDTGRMPPRA